MAGQPWTLLSRRTWVVQEDGRGPGGAVWRGRAVACELSDTRLPIGWEKSRQVPAALDGVEVSRSLAHRLQQRTEGPLVVHRVVNDHHHVFRARTSRRRSFRQAGRWPRCCSSFSRACLPLAFYRSSSPAARPNREQQTARPPPASSHTLPFFQDSPFHGRG